MDTPSPAILRDTEYRSFKKEEKMERDEERTLKVLTLSVALGAMFVLGGGLGYLWGSGAFSATAYEPPLAESSQTPVCDQLDNNCGACDNGRCPNGNSCKLDAECVTVYDVVFVVDVSGSMTEEIEHIKTVIHAAHQYELGYRNPNARFALVTFPPKENEDYPVEVRSELDTFGNFQRTVRSLEAENLGDENAWDAVGMVVDGGVIHWRANTKHIIVVFTDEDARWADTGEIITPENVLCDSVGEATLIVWTLPQYQVGWNECAFYPSTPGEAVHAVFNRL